MIFKFNRISKVLSRTDDTLIISAATLSPNWLKSLPSDLSNMVVSTAAELQTKTSAFSDENENAMIAKWQSDGGSLITLPESDLSKIRASLAGVGEKVTKDDPKLHAFYKKIKATGAKY